MQDFDMATEVHISRCPPSSCLWPLCCCVPQVHDNSPGHQAGLEPFFDFIISICDTRLVGSQQEDFTHVLPGAVMECFCRTGTTAPWNSCWTWMWKDPSRCCYTTAGRWLSGRRPSCPAACGAAGGSSGSAFASAALKKQMKMFGTFWWVV